MICTLLKKDFYFHLFLLKGYFCANGETKDGTDGTSAFFEEGGKRWFRSGDIGEFDKDGKPTFIL